MKPTRFVFNHFTVFNETSQKWEVHEYNSQLKKSQKTDCRILGTPIALGETAEESIENAVAKGIRSWDIKVVS